MYLLVPAHPGSPGQGPLYACVCVCDTMDARNWLYILPVSAGAARRLWWFFGFIKLVDVVVSDWLQRQRLTRAQTPSARSRLCNVERGRCRLEALVNVGQQSVPDARVVGRLQGVHEAHAVQQVTGHDSWCVTPCGAPKQQRNCVDSRLRRRRRLPHDTIRDAILTCAQKPT